MAQLAQLFFILYAASVIAIVIYVLWLLSRFVNAHEKMANAIEIVARKTQEGGK